MSDPDADAVLASLSHPEASGDADAAAVLASYSNPAPAPAAAAPRTYVSPVDAPRPANVVDAAVGSVLQNSIAGIGGGYKGLVTLLKGKGMDEAANVINDYVSKNSYQPNSKVGKNTAAVLASPYNPMNLPATIGHGLGRGAEALGAPPGLSATLEAAPTAIGAVLGLRGGAPAVIDAQQALNKAALDSPQSMGAAASAPNINALSPPLQAAVRSGVQKTGGAINPEILARHAEADSLPVKMQLTEGQASQDPNIISHEMNTRGRTPEMVDRLNEQNSQLIKNVQALRETVGPDVFSPTTVDHGASLIDAYKQKDAPIKADITSKYKALEDANGGQFPLDTDSFVRSTDAALSRALKSNSVPSDLSATLNEFRNGRPMTFEDFESLRSDAADAARTSTDGRQRAAAGIIRDQLEKMPLTEEAAKLKPLADAARAAAKARFQALDADPAYDAAVHGTVPEDRFVSRFITGPTATRNGVATMRENLADNPTATQTMGVSALDQLRNAAGINEKWEGNFTQNGFNKALQALGPKIPSLFDPKTAETLDTLGNVARYTQSQPRGAYVNNSNSGVALIAEHAANIAEKTGNAIGGGLIPFGTLARGSLQKRAAAKATAKSLAPGAGITRLSDVTKQ